MSANTNLGDQEFIQIGEPGVKPYPGEILSRFRWGGAEMAISVCAPPDTGG